MKCNLDCDYCTTGIYGGHDNTQRHPPLEDCLRTIDFMYQYVDKIMDTRIPGLRKVILNIYGGESLHHPDIVTILKSAREKHQQYTDKWHLTVTTTTNAIIPEKKFAKIIDLVDEFTVSWHTNNTDKQKTQFRNNTLAIKNQNRRVKCIVLMHPKLFDDAQLQIQWCQDNNIKYLPRQLDHPKEGTQFNYSSQQVVFFEKLYKKELTPVKDVNDRADLSSTGRACCGGRSLCVDQNYRQTSKFVPNNFNNWYCSVDKFFLYVKQVNGEIYTNRDCKVGYNSKLEPIGNLSGTEEILNQIGQTPIIQCIKDRCDCGLCAPKAADINTFKNIMRKYEIPNSNLL